MRNESIENYVVSLDHFVSQMLNEKWQLDFSTDVVYQISLVLSFVLAFAVPHIKQGKPRALFTSVVGAITLLMMAGTEIGHWLFISAVSILLIRLLHKTTWCGPAVFIIAFGYQGWVRYLDLFDIYKLSTPANTIILMQSLKVVAMAYDAQKAGSPQPFGNSVHYLLFFPGVWSGPYLGYNDVMDTLSRQYTKDHPKPNQIGFALYRLACSWWYFFFFFVVGKYFPTEYLLTEEYSFLPMWLRIVILHGTVIMFRSRLCTCWAISDATCGVAGVSYNASERFRIDWNKVWGVTSLQVELAPSLQHEIRNWNRSVQGWMATYPYKYSPFASRVARQVYTMSVSAYWHGLNAGYFMAFSLFPFFQAAQEKTFDQPLPGELTSKLAARFWDAVRRLVTGMLMSFSIVPFVFLSIEDSLLAWRNMSYFGFVLMGTFFLIGLLTRKHRKAYKKLLKSQKDALEVDKQLEKVAEEVAQAAQDVTGDKHVPKAPHHRRGSLPKTQ